MRRRTSGTRFFVCCRTGLPFNLSSSRQKPRIRFLVEGVSHGSRLRRLPIWASTPLDPGADFAAGLRTEIQFALESGGIILLLGSHWRPVYLERNCRDSKMLRCGTLPREANPGVSSPHDYPAFTANIPEGLRLAPDALSTGRHFPSCAFRPAAAHSYAHSVERRLAIPLPMAAALLGMKPTTLASRIKALGLQR